MLDNKKFLYTLMAALLAFYGTALVLALQGQTSHVIVRITLIVWCVHLLEIPLAFYRLKIRNPQPLGVIIGTFFFGMLWLLPARRGVFPVR